MIVILEGPRGTGKSSLAKAFLPVLTEIGYTPTIFKAERGPDPHNDMRETLARLQVETASNPNKAVIIDRFHLTEFVMRMADGTVPRGKLMYEMVHFAYLTEKMGAWVAVLNAPEGTRRERVLARNDGRGDESIEVMRCWGFVKDFLDAYDGERTFNNTFIVETSAFTPEQIAKQMLIRFKIRAEINAKK